jgi:putative peptidoglycan lipid II flippase
MAERWAAADAEGVAGACSRGLRDTEVAMLPAAIGLTVMAGPIVALLAGYGAIGVDDQELLAHTLAAFAIGLPFFSAFQLLTRTAYATSDSRTPALINIGAAIVNLVAAWAFAFALGLGVPGMALGHATSYLVGSIGLFLAVRSRIGDLHARRIASTLGRALAAAVCSGAAALAVTWLIAEVLPVERPLLRAVQVVAGVVAGVLVFAASALMFGVSEVDDVRKALTSRFQR